MIGLGLGLSLRSGKTAPAVSAPTNTVAPAVTGTPSVGQVLTTSNGTWTGSPTGYTYQWRRDGVAISGATASTYTVQSADAGKALTCAVTATNAGGSTTAVSNSVAIPAGRTYADWQAEATRLATSGFKDFDTNFNSGDRPAVYKTTAATPNNTLYGSSWGGRAFSVNFGSIGRVVQHGMQSQALFNEQVSGGYDIVVQIASAANQDVLAFTRNGYTSLNGTANPDAFAATCTGLYRWDNTLKKVFFSNPFAGGAETEYVW